MIRDLLRTAASGLAAIEAGNPRLEAEYLLAEAMEIPRPVLLGRDPTGDPGPGARTRFEALLARRLSRSPLQYVLGTVPFAGLDLVIGPGALIPRGETEILVEQVAAELAGNGAESSPGDRPPEDLPPGPWGIPPESGGASGNRPPLLVDVGTGSGAIALALLERLPAWRALGIDRSPVALGWAWRNACRCPGGARLWLLRADLLEPIGPRTAAAIVSNPPYVRTGEISGLAPEVRDHEPLEALDGGADGLDPFRRLVPAAARVLCPGGLLAVELAPDQPEIAAGLLERTGEFTGIRIFLDLAGRRRGLLARRA